MLLVGWVPSTAPYGAAASAPQHAHRQRGGLVFTNIGSGSTVDTTWGACAAIFTQLDNEGRIDLVVADCNEVFFASTPFELLLPSVRPPKVRRWVTGTGCCVSWRRPPTRMPSSRFSQQRRRGQTTNALAAR